MTPQEFESAFHPISIKWKRAYNNDQVALIHEAVRNFSFEQLQTVVKKLLGSQRLAPMVPDFERVFQEMRFYPVRAQESVGRRIEYNLDENILYRVRDNIWADSTHVYIRGPKPSFIIIQDDPENHLVKEALSVKSARVAEIKNHIKQNTYNRFIDKENAPMKTLDFSGFSA